MPWVDSGMLCDTECGQLYPMLRDQHETSQFARALGWHHGAGVTHGGSPYEAMLCPDCSGNAKKRKTLRSTIENVPLPGMEEMEVEIQRERY